MRLTPASRTLLRGPAVVTLLTIFAVAIHGYHPYGEDGGLYVAGVKKLLNPALYPAWTDFVTGHLRFSLFAPAVAELVRTSHLPLDVILLLLYLASIWATLYAAWMLASRLTRLLQARIGSVALLACWLTLPIAGTSLVLMDPYVTARSLSTPLVILAIAWALDRKPIRRILCTASLTVAALLHPLMAAYGTSGCHPRLLYQRIVAAPSPLRDHLSCYSSPWLQRL